MFFPLTVLLIAVGAALGENECMMRTYTECRIEESPREFPSTPEHLERYCKNLQNFFTCAKNILENCEGEEVFALEAENILNKLKESCDENGDTYKVLSKHISCVGPMLNGRGFDSCYRIMAFEEDNTILEIFREGNEDLNKCLFVKSHILCTAVRISKRCGAELKDVISDLMMKFGNFIYAEIKDCTPEIISQLEPHMESFENYLMLQEF